MQKSNGLEYRYPTAKEVRSGAYRVQLWGSSTFKFFICCLLKLLALFRHHNISDMKKIDLQNPFDLISYQNKNFCTITYPKMSS